MTFTPNDINLAHILLSLTIYAITSGTAGNVTPSTDTSGAWRAATIALSIVSGIALLAVVGFLLVYFLKLRPMLSETTGPSAVSWSPNANDQTDQNN